MNIFKFDDFKKLCYQIEAILNRSWLVTQLSGENYPKTFYYTKFIDGSDSKKQILLLCNKSGPIFAFADPLQIETFDYFEGGFIKNREICDALSIAMKNVQSAYDVLSPEILLLEFNGKNDFEKKLVSVGIKETEIALTLNTIRPDLFNYKLFHGKNIGLDLFNSEDD